MSEHDKANILSELRCNLYRAISTGDASKARLLAIRVCVVTRLEIYKPETIR